MPDKTAVESAITVLSEAIRFSNHLPQRAALSFAVERLRDDLAATASVADATLDAGLATWFGVDQPQVPGIEPDELRASMSRVFEAMASDLARRSSILAARASYGIRPEIIAFAHHLEDQARKTELQTNPAGLGVSLHSAARHLTSISTLQGARSEVPANVGHEILSALVKAALPAIAMANHAGQLPAPDYAALAQAGAEAGQLRRFRECLEDISHLLELPQSESGPCDSAAEYVAEIEGLLGSLARTEQERIQHAQARFIAEAELHQYKAVGRKPIPAAYPDNAVIARLTEICSALAPDANPEGEIAFAGDAGNWAWLLGELSKAELESTTPTALTILAEAAGVLAPFADYVAAMAGRYGFEGWSDSYVPVKAVELGAFRAAHALASKIAGLDLSGKAAPSELPSKLFVVNRRSGEYDERSDDIIAAYFDPAIAEAHALAAQAWWDAEIEPLRHSIPPGPAGATAADAFYKKCGESPYDPTQFGSNQRYYSCETVDIDSTPPAGVAALAKTENGSEPDV